VTTPHMINQCAVALVQASNEERSLKVCEAIFKLLESTGVNTPDGVLGLLGACAIQIADQFKIPEADANRVISAMLTKFEAETLS